MLAAAGRQQKHLGDKTGQGMATLTRRELVCCSRIEVCEVSVMARDYHWSRCRVYAPVQAPSQHQTPVLKFPMQAQSLMHMYAVLKVQKAVSQRLEDESLDSSKKA